jgi:transcriptional regulator with XRE-family HTH domain
MKSPRNAIGPRIRKLRYKLKLSQPELAARCQLIGRNIGRDTVAKIEDQRRWIGDFEIVGLALALGIKPEMLLPSKEEALRLCRTSKRLLD